MIDRQQAAMMIGMATSIPTEKPDDPPKQSSASDVEPQVMRSYDVYVEQVNQVRVRVKATSRQEAAEKGYKKWKREWAHSRVISVEDA